MQSATYGHANGFQVHVGCAVVEHSNKQHRIITSGTVSLSTCAGGAVQEVLLVEDTFCWTGCAGGAVQEAV